MKMYFGLTTDELLAKLKEIDISISEAGTPKSQIELNDEDDDYEDDYQSNLELGWHLSELREERENLIKFFVEHIGFNPDNLCTTAQRCKICGEIEHFDNCPNA